MEYNFREIEKKWQQKWVEQKTYQVTEDESKQYGLPAEQYAIQTGQHPAITTQNNINRYREQLDKIGFSFDWDREVRTCDPKYYHWTQWAFQKMFNSFYCNTCGKAQPIEKLIEHFEKQGTEGLDARKAGYRRAGRSLLGRTELQRRRMEGNERKAATGNADELPHRLPGRNHGKLVSATGYGAGKR